MELTDRTTEAEYQQRMTAVIAGYSGYGPLSATMEERTGTLKVGLTFSYDLAQAEGTVTLILSDVAYIITLQGTVMSLSIVSGSTVLFTSTSSSGLQSIKVKGRQLVNTLDTSLEENQDLIRFILGTSKGIAEGLSVLGRRYVHY